jgi:exosortase/archaeosortase family protein
MAYSIPQSPFIALALFLIVLGITILLQSSRAFQTNNDVKLIFTIFFSALLVIVIDFWPIQWSYSQAVATFLQVTGIIPIQYLTPHLGGVQVVIYIREAVTMRIVGGEIDNACAGLIALIPCLTLLILANRSAEYKPDRIIVGLLAICIIVLGNLFRIFIELWAPGVGVMPFELVHYPLAFFLGYFGVSVIAILGQRLLRQEKELPPKS